MTDNIKRDWEPGRILTMSGNIVRIKDLVVTGDGLSIEDIAWGLGRTLRYGGHIKVDHTVAHHSIIMSHVVPEEYALEALLHDATEAYIGDIIWPVKAMFPEVEALENAITHNVMQKFGCTTAEQDTAFVAAAGAEVPIYRKSEVIQRADVAMYEHECWSFGRPGAFHPDIEKAWIEAGGLHHVDYWYAAQYSFLERFDQLTGSSTLDLDRLTALWFPEPEDNKDVEAAERILQETMLFIEQTRAKQEEEAHAND